MVKDKNIKIGLAGDVMIGRLVNQHLNHVSPQYIWGNTLPLLKSSDLNLINLEVALTTSDKIIPKVFNFKADPFKVQSLKDASIDVVNLANNHILDFSEEGLLETLTTLENAHIQYVGAGRNLQEASKPLIIEKGGLKIGIIGCTDNEPTWKAQKQQPGTHYLDIGDIEAIESTIINLKSQVNFLILTIHWGPNMKIRPSRSFINFAHHLIERGVDLIHGHSAHIFQGIEHYLGKMILYDTGDFIDDYSVDPILRNDRSFFFLVEINQNGFQSLKAIPTLISNFQVNFSEGDEAKETLDRMQTLSNEFHTPLFLDSIEIEGKPLPCLNFQA